MTALDRDPTDEYSGPSLLFKGKRHWFARARLRLSQERARVAKTGQIGKYKYGSLDFTTMRILRTGPGLPDPCSIEV